MMRLALAILMIWSGVAGSATGKPVEISIKYFSESVGDDVAGKAQAAVLEEFAVRNPEVVLRPWSGLKLPGEMWMQADLLAFAAGVAADVQPLFFQQVQFYAEQGLLAPLDKQVLGPPAWDYWATVAPGFREAVKFRGEIVAVPTGCFSGAMIFRRDLFEQAGLDPDRPPQTLEELWKVCQRLTDPAATGPDGQSLPRYALGVEDMQDFLLGFFNALGTVAIETEWVNAEGSIQVVLPLGSEPSGRHGLTPRYRAAFDSPAGREALAWMWKFRWAPWVRDAATGQIRDLSEDEALVTPGVIRGVLRPAVNQDDRDRLTQLRRGRVAMAGVTLGSQNPFLQQPGLGIAPFPPLRAGDPSPLPLLPMTLALNRGLLADPGRFAAGWEWVKYRSGPDAARIANQVYIENGLARILSTWELRRSGLDDLRSLLPAQWREAQDYIFSSPYVVPFVNGWEPIEQELEKAVVQPLMNDRRFDYANALAAVSATANEKVFGRLPPEEQSRRYELSWLAFGFTVIALLLGGGAVVRSQMKQARESAGQRSRAPGVGSLRPMILSAFLLLPALVLLAVFSYYPIGRGLVMAFQDYRLVGESAFVGLMNFSEGLFASRFWLAAWNTLIFVAINMALGFFAPFLLAVLVSELPVGTSWFRTIFYLPAVIAGLVVTLLWMRLYEPTEHGLLNQFLEPVFHAWNALVPSGWKAEWPVAWLQDSRWAMVAVIVPTIWASAGPGSLIYLAALKSIPDEMYEAADLDGCGPWGKFLKITVPAVFPLLLINFIGAFIGTFHGMGNIFVMTGGGPNFATHVLALEIWQNAFLYLRFGVATAQAWVLAATLIGFVVLQLRILEKMDWRRAGA